MKFFGGWRYPAKKDGNGKSARKRAFELFGEGLRPSQVCKMIPISLRTVCRYYEDFKKLHHRLPYSTIRRWIKENPEFSEKVIAILATSLEMSQEEVITRMQRPWALLGALKGQWPDYGLEKQRSEIEERLLAALEIIKFADMFAHKDPQLVRETIKQLMIDIGEESPET